MKNAELVFDTEGGAEERRGGFNREKGRQEEKLKNKNFFFPFSLFNKAQSMALCFIFIFSEILWFLDDLGSRRP